MIMNYYNVHCTKQNNYENSMWRKLLYMNEGYCGLSCEHVTTESSEALAWIPLVFTGSKSKIIQVILDYETQDCIQEKYLARQRW